MPTPFRARCLPAILLVLGVALPAEEVILRPRPVEWAQPMLGTTIGNLHQVSPEVYRCEQPDDDQLPELRKLGIKSMLSLREYHSDVDEFTDAGIVLIRVPMDAGKIDAALLRTAVQAIIEAPKPILVHCWHGSDRTGAVIAAYRMVVQQWPRGQAVDEFVNGGFGYHETWYPNIRTLLNEVKIEDLR